MHLKMVRVEPEEENAS